MRTLPWMMIAGAGIGAATILLMNRSQPEYETGSDGIERAARKTFGWGTKKRVQGAVGSVAGAVKGGVGWLAGNDRMAREGDADRVAGNVTHAAGTVGQAVGQTIHDLNR